MAAVKGDSVDRVLISYFDHNHAAQYSPDALVPTLLQHNQKFDWDFIEVLLWTSYYMEAWGCTYSFDPEKGTILQDYVVKTAEDYKKLEKLDPTQDPFGGHVKLLAISLVGVEFSFGDQKFNRKFLKMTSGTSQGIWYPVSAGISSG